MVLDKPIRDGWFRTLKLRNDILKSKHADGYQEILNAVVVEVWGRDQKHADKNWVKYFKKTPVAHPYPGVRYLSEKQYLKLSDKAKKIFRPFVKNPHYRMKKVYFCQIPIYYLKTTYRRAYITKFKITSPILKSRAQEIEEYLSNGDLRKYFYRGGRYQLWFNENKRNRRKINMQLRNFDVLNDEF